MWFRAEKKELKSFSYMFFLSFFSKNDMLSTLEPPPGVLFSAFVYQTEIMFGLVSDGGLHLAYTRHHIIDAKTKDAGPGIKFF